MSCLGVLFILWVWVEFGEVFSPSLEEHILDLGIAAMYKPKSESISHKTNRIIQSELTANLSKILFCSSVKFKYLSSGSKYFL